MDYRNLVAWQEAYRLVLLVYRATGSFPASERYGLVSQMRRASVSVASNLAEGAGRGTRGELRRFAAIALGSLHELTTQLSLARDLALSHPEEADELLRSAERVGRLLSGLARRS